VEELVAWFVVQSLEILVLAFLLGVLVGWLWWRRRKVHFSESGALTTVAARHEATLEAKQRELDRSGAALTEKDLEIGHLRTLVTGDTLELAALHDRELSAKDEQITELRAQLQLRDTQLGARAAELGTRDAEIDRLSALIEQAESLTAIQTGELASRDDRVAAQQSMLADRDTEVSRLSAALNAALNAMPARGGDGSATGPADAGGPAISLAPTDPAPEQLAAFLTPVEATGAIPAASPGENSGTTEPGPAPADDLERVEGIGPRIGTALREAGIVTFRQLAEAELTTLQTALEKAGLRFAPSLPTWSRQAELLANGDEDAFAELADRLVTGRGASGAK
jgi:predicted flap endonuclease-1-like 5' DNA nuclease